jgi:hypothetical protein
MQGFLPETDLTDLADLLAEEMAPWFATPIFEDLACQGVGNLA